MAVPTVLYVEGTLAGATLTVRMEWTLTSTVGASQASISVESSIGESVDILKLFLKIRTMPLAFKIYQI